jgi:hypothetical protein
MFGKHILFIAIVILVLIIPSVQVFATAEATQKYTEEIPNSTSDIDSMKDVTGQQVYEYYQAIKLKNGKKVAVLAIAKLIEPILDEYVQFGLHKPTAYAQLFMESGFLSAKLSRVGNNPYGIKGTGYISTTNEYMDGKMYVLDLPFEAFENFEEGIRGYCRLMMHSRYLPVRAASNYVAAAKSIKKCGYASDPDYVGDGDIQNKPIIGMLDNIEAYELNQFGRNTLDSKTRYKHIWRTIRKQNGAQFLAYWYLKPRIKEIQKELHSLGFYAGKFDGWFGKKSEAAVVAFQKKFGLDVDGVVGIYTYEALFSEKFSAKIVIPAVGEDPEVLEPISEEPPKQTIIAEALWNITASSYLVPQNANNGPYDISQINDNDLSTCWIPGNIRNGTGESIVLELVNAEKAHIKWLSIFGGYGKNKTTYFCNLRIKTITIIIDGKEIGDYELEDIQDYQKIIFPENIFGSKIVVLVNDYYPSVKYNGHKAWDDLCISEVNLKGDIQIE